MRFLQTFSAALLLVLWPALTSHTLLEQLGVIHVVHEDHHGEGGSHEHGSGNHQFADGDYRDSSSAVSLTKPSVFKASSFPADHLFASVFITDEVPGPAPPPDSDLLQLASSWQFQYRTALPVRAPSLLL